MATDNIKAFLRLGFSAGKVVAALADGFQLGDLGEIVGAAKNIPGGLAAAPKALSEYLNMTDAEAEPLEAWVVTEFSVPDHNVELAVETALGVVIQLHSLARLIAPKA